MWVARPLAVRHCLMSRRLIGRLGGSQAFGFDLIFSVLPKHKYACMDVFVHIFLHVPDVLHLQQSQAAMTITNRYGLCMDTWNSRKPP